MAHAQKSDFVFRRNGRVHLNRRGAGGGGWGGGVSSVYYWQVNCAHQTAGFILLVRACVQQSRDVYWLPTPFYCFSFTSPTRASPCAITFQLDSLAFIDLSFWHRSFTFNSNKSPTRCNNFSVYYPDICLQLNMFRAFSRPSSGAQWLQWQPLVLPSYRCDSRAVFVVGPAVRPARPQTQHDCHHVGNCGEFLD
jgi:hypothetical protein